MFAKLDEFGIGLWFDPLPQLPHVFEATLKPTLNRDALIIGQGEFLIQSIHQIRDGCFLSRDRRGRPVMGHERSGGGASQEDHCGS